MLEVRVIASFIAFYPINIRLKLSDCFLFLSCIVFKISVYIPYNSDTFLLFNASSFIVEICVIFSFIFNSNSYFFVKRLSIVSSLRNKVGRKCEIPHLMTPMLHLLF